MRTFSDIINPIPRKIEHPTASRFPIVKSLEKLNLFPTIIIAPQIANPNPINIPLVCFRFKINRSIIKVNRGASVPRKVAFAIVVSLIDPKNSAK